MASGCTQVMRLSMRLLMPLLAISEHRERWCLTRSVGMPLGCQQRILLLKQGRHHRKPLAKILLISSIRCSVWGRVLTGLVRLPHQIRNITSGPNGFLLSFSREDWHTRKRVASGGAQLTRRCLQMSKWRVAIVGAVVVWLKSDV